MKMTKRCEYVLEDGHKCNKMFRTRLMNQKYCDNHVGNNQADSHLSGHTTLVKSTNAYAQGGNNESMRKWVMHKMSVEKIERQTIADLEAKVARLEKIIDNIATNKKVVQSVMKEELRSDFFIRRVDAIVVKRLQKSFRGEEE